MVIDVRNQQILTLMIEYEIDYPEAAIMLLDIEWRASYSEPANKEEMIEISFSKVKLQDSPGQGILF